MCKLNFMETEQQKKFEHDEAVQTIKELGDIIMHLQTQVDELQAELDIRSDFDADAIDPYDLYGPTKLGFDDPNTYSWD